ncbi:MAG: anaerobic ribonucleoside-triphosphate reductase activating protein [Candidatus Omnitrophica bacterium]|nr:anaerobic ribonucleoside-triphosphate reductase activating protein [Candidatus Omnitrophota bacterium]
MKIAGLQKVSLVDYPGCVSAVVFVQGCNLRCPYCQNPDLVVPESGFECSEKEVFDYLTARRKLIEGVVITGGEPTIYEDLPDFIKHAKDIGIKVKLDTNGSNPEQLEYLLHENLLDYIAIDVKSSFNKYYLLSDAENVEWSVAESINLTMSSGVPYEFRTTCVPGIVDAEDFHSIGDTVKGAKKYYLQQFRPQTTYDKEYQNIKPYTDRELQKFKLILEEYVEEVKIRGA